MINKDTKSFKISFTASRDNKDPFLEIDQNKYIIFTLNSLNNGICPIVLSRRESELKIL